MARTSPVSAAGGGHRDNAVTPAAYTDPRIYQAEMAQVFEGPVWVLVAHASELPAVGDGKAHVIGQVHVEVVRVAEDEFRITERSAPHRVARVGVVKGAVFATFSSGAPPLDDYLGGDVGRALDVALGDGDLEYLGVQRTVFGANWKMYVENIYDSYHAVTLHKGLRMMRIKKPGERPDRDHEVRFGHYLTQYLAEAPTRPVLRDMELFSTLSRDESSHLILNVFPAGVITETLDIIQFRYIVPRGVDRTEVQFHLFGQRGDSEEVHRSRLWQSANFLGPEGMVNLEDGAALARMGAGLRAKQITGQPGVTPEQNPPYRADEAVIRHFYDAYDRLMGDGPVPQTAVTV